MGKGLGKIFLFAVLIILFVGLASAGFWNNFFGKITGNPVSYDYLCGDSDLNGEINEEDITKISDYAFGGAEIPSEAKVDLNADGVIDILDVTILTNYVKRGGPKPTCSSETSLSESYQASSTACGNIDKDSDIDSIDIDLLKNYVFEGGTISQDVNPDLNRDGVSDILDVTVLVNYVYRSGPAPTCVTFQVIDKCSSLNLSVKNKVAELQASGETVVKKEGEFVNGKDYLIIADSGAGRILRVEVIRNDSSGYAEDEVVFEEVMTGNKYETTILVEGVGVVTIDGRAYDVRYYGRSIDSVVDKKITLMWPPANEIHTFYCSFPQSQTCNNDCVAVGLTMCYEDSGLLKICGNYDSDSCLEWSVGTTCPFGCNVNGCNSQQNQTNFSCLDSDGGKNYNIQGTINAVTSIVQDYCWGDNQLTEYYCSGNMFNATYYSCSLENKICLNGACVISNQTNFCTDTDNGVDFYVKGGVYRIESGVRLPTTGYDYDYCQGVGGNMVSEFSCGEEYSLKQTDFVCPGGCVNGVCKKVEVTPNLKVGPIELPDSVYDEEGVSYDCSGCVEDKKCYPFGYRKGGMYCSDNFDFVDQHQEDSVCENNFECGSNVCISGECVSEGLIKKILNWFKNIF